MFKNIYEEIAYKFKHLPGLKPKSVKNNPYFNASVNDEFVHNLNPDRYNFYMNFMRALADPEVVKNVIYENNLIKVDQEEQSKLVENIIGKLGDLYQLDEYEKKQIINIENERKKNVEKTSKIVDRISDILTDTSEKNKGDIKKEVKETFDIFATGVNYDKMEREIKAAEKKAAEEKETAEKKAAEEKETAEKKAAEEKETAEKKAAKEKAAEEKDAYDDSKGTDDDFMNKYGDPKGTDDDFMNANDDSRGTDDDFMNANDDSRGTTERAFTDDAINDLKDGKDDLIGDGILENKIKQFGGDAGDKYQQIYDQMYSNSTQDSTGYPSALKDFSSVSDLTEQNIENVEGPEQLVVSQEQINEQNAANIKKNIQEQKEDFKKNTDLWKKKKELDEIREDTNKSDSDKAEDLKKIIDDIEGDGIMSIKRLEVSREDRLIFIGLTFLLRIVVLTLIEWSLNTNFILTFTNAFLLYICVYSILFVIIIIIVNITYNYPIMDLYTGNHGIFTSMASSLYYFYLIPGSESKHLVRLGVHLGFIIFLTMIAILIKGNEEKNNEGLNYDYAVKRNIKRVINDFTMLLWIFTSIIAMYMI
jgi:hypothetical protein